MKQPTRQKWSERILILAPTDPYGRLAREMLEQAKFSTAMCSTIDDVCETIVRGAGAVLIEEEALTPPALRKLGEQLTIQPAWSDLPLIILTTGCDAPHAQLHTEEALAKIGNVSFVERPFRIHTLISCARAALRARRRQYDARDLLQKQEQAVQRLELLADVANHFLLSEKPREIVGNVFDKISRQLGLEVYLHYLFDPLGNQLQLSASGGIPEEVLAPFKSMSLQQSSIAASVVKLRRSIVVEDVQSSSDPQHSLVRSIGLTAYVSYPLIANDDLIGTLAFGTRKSRHFGHEELMLMEAVCHQVSVAIQRKRTEEALYDLTEQLDRRVQERTSQLQETSEQMEAFCYSISHDLRAPLRTIRGFSQAILEDYSNLLDATGKEYLQRVMSGAEKMDSLIQDLLEYSRLGRSKLTFEPIHLEASIDRILLQLEQEVQSKQATVSVRKPLHVVHGHAQTLEQMLINLLTNALKFVRPGVAPQISIWSAEAENHIRIWVEDNGIGIAPEHQNRIFGVFERLHGVESYPGTGIGLAIVAKGAARMGGRTGVESVPNFGSRFWIDLPKVINSPA